MSGVITFGRSGTSYLHACRFKYNQGFIEELKLLPGARWNKIEQYWLTPVELQSKIVETASMFGFASVPPPVLLASSRSGQFNPKLYPFQHTAVERALDTGALLLNFEMGLGKTPTAIETLRLACPEHTLIVCPALVRQNWADEIAKWWPDAPAVEIIDSGKKDIATAGAWITSYELLSSAPDNIQWDAVVLDESHYIKESRSQRSKVVAGLTAKLKLALTGTAITNQPKDLWNQLHWLYPLRFGTWWQFTRRYCEIEDNGYGELVKGINPEFSRELEERLKAVAARATKKEWAHLLPACDVRTIRIKHKDRAQYELTPAGVEEFLNASYPLKSKIATEYALEAIDNGATHVCVLTYHKRTADLIAQQLETQVKTVHVDGTLPIKKRLEAIAGAKAMSRCVLVATMSSVNEGISLTDFTSAFFAELYYSPKVMLQALGRFQRLSGKAPSSVSLLCLEGTVDEAISRALEYKIQNINSIIQPGQTESSIERALEEESQSDEEFFSELRELVATRAVEEEY
jgi:SNF2 family DNA or RNA helicase